MNFFGSKKNIDHPVAWVTEIRNKNEQKVNKTVFLKTAPGIEPIDMSDWSPQATNQNKHLNNYINELVKENERLQNMLDDMKTTTMLNKQMLNEYVNLINEQNEEIKGLKQTNSKLSQDINWLNAQLKSLKKDQFSVSVSSDKSIEASHKSHSNKKPPMPEIRSKKDGNFSHRQLDLLQEIDRLKVELQSIAPLLDEEPEKTKIKYLSSQSKEIAKLLCQDPTDEELGEKLQSLLDASRKQNQKIIFSDKNNQLWEIAMVRV